MVVVVVVVDAAVLVLLEEEVSGLNVVGPRVESAVGDDGELESGVEGEDSGDEGEEPGVEGEELGDEGEEPGDEGELTVSLKLQVARQPRAACASGDASAEVQLRMQSASPKHRAVQKYCGRHVSSARQATKAP